MNKNLCELNCNELEDINGGNILSNLYKLYKGYQFANGLYQMYQDARQGYSGGVNGR